MSFWDEHDLTSAVVAILSDADGDPEHPYGPPFLTAYQLAIEIDRRHPDIVRALGRPLGGAGAGSHASFTSYLAGELARLIKAGALDNRVEGAFLSSRRWAAASFRRNDGSVVESSMPESGSPTSLFRRRR